MRNAQNWSSFLWQIALISGIYTCIHLSLAIRMRFLSIRRTDWTETFMPSINAADENNCFSFGWFMKGSKHDHISLKRATRMEKFVFITDTLSSKAKEKSFSLWPVTFVSRKITSCIQNQKDTMKPPYSEALSYLKEFAVQCSNRLNILPLQRILNSRQIHQNRQTEESLHLTW